MTQQRLIGSAYSKLLFYSRASAVLLAGVCLAAATAHAGPPAGDHDGDGLSDISAVTVNRGSNNSGTTTWKVRKSSGGEIIHTFGLPGDALVQGKFWFGDNKVYPGIVYVSDANRPLNWYLKQPNGQDFYLNYGLPGDSIPTQGDLDCDGIVDLTVTRNGSDGYKRWYVRSSTRGFQTFEELFGLNSDRAAIIDTNGDGCAEKVAVRGDFNWFAQRFSQGFFTQVQWGLPGDYPLLPQDINGNNIADYVIVRPSGISQVAYVRYDNGTWESFGIPSLSDAVPFLGNFLEFGKAGFGWWQRNQNLAAQLLPNRVTPFVFNFGTSGATLVRPDGTVVQANDSARLGSTSTGGGSSGGGSGGSGGSSGGSFGTVQCTRSFGLPKEPHGWRPNTSRNRPKFIVGSSYTSALFGRSELRLYTEDGQFLTSVRPFGTLEHGGRVRYYGPALSSLPQTIRAVAASNDGQTVLCYGPFNSRTQYKR